MGEQKNLTQDDVLDLMGKFPLEPMFNKVCITLNTLEADGNLILSDNMISDCQFIVAKGPMVNGVEIGQKVLIDIEKLMKPKGYEANNQYEEVREVQLDLIEVNGQRFAFVEDRVIKAKDNR
jgi:hypothetical protein